MIMKKLLSVTAAGLLLFATSFQARAIEDPDPVGSITASAYLGLLPGVGANAAADYVLINKWWKGHFTVGGYAGLYGDKTSDSVSVSGVTAKNSTKYHYFTVMPRATYGLNITDSFEVHAGTMVGMQFSYSKTKGSVSSSAAGVDGKEKKSETSLGVAYGELVGCRYFFTDNFGVSAECSVGTVTYLNLGISYRF